VSDNRIRGRVFLPASSLQEGDTIKASVQVSVDPLKFEVMEITITGIGEAQPGFLTVGDGVHGVQLSPRERVEVVEWDNWREERCYDRQFIRMPWHEPDRSEVVCGRCHRRTDDLIGESR
jgi:hypothetical protein